jgi:hypothetical protein
MDTFELKECVGLALVRNANLFPISEVRILSGERIRQFLNNLLGLGEFHYLEVGVYCGGSFSAATYHNDKLASVTAIDSWAERFGGGAQPKKEFLEAVAKYVPKNVPFTLIENNCWAVDKLSHAPDVFYYDGPHTALDQEKALTHFGPMCAKQFIYICDDYNWKQVQAGTRKGLEKFNVIWELEIFSRGDSQPDWWNGLFIAVLEQK